MRGDPAPWPPPADLVAQAAAGDDEALTAIVRAGYPKLVGFYRAAGAEDPGDLAADVVVSVLSSLPRLRKPQAFEAWFWAIARATFRTWLRRRRRPERGPPPPPRPAEPPELAEMAMEHARIRAALEALSPQERALLWLREVEGLSYAQLAGWLGSAVGTVRVAAHRARRKLERAYRDRA